MGQDCLDRSTLKALAAGRCPPKELRAVQRHLPTCARCRAAVVASAAGVRGPGDTVLLTRRGRGGARTGLKVASVALSLLVVAGAWRYGQSSPLSAPALPAVDLPPSGGGREALPSAEARPDTVELAAPLQPAEPGLTLAPSELAPAAAPGVAVRPVYEPDTVEPPVVRAASVQPSNEPAAALEAARPAPAEPSSRRPSRKKQQRPAAPSAQAELPSTNEGEGTDRFGLEW